MNDSPLKFLYKNNKKYIFVISLLSLVYSFFLSYPLSILRDYIDYAADSQNIIFEKIIFLVITYLICLIVSYTILNFQRLYISKVQNKLSHKLRLRTYDHLSMLYNDFFENNDISVIVNKVIQDSDIIVQGFISPVKNISKFVFSFGFGFYFMWMISPYFTLIILPFSILLGLVTKFSGGKFKYLATENRKKNSLMWKALQENLKGIRDIHALNQEEQQRDYIADVSKQMTDNYIGTAKYAFIMNMVNNLTFVLLISALVIGGSFLIHYKIITVGAIAAIITYNNLLTNPIQELISMFQDLFKVKASIIRIQELYSIKIDESYLNTKEKNINFEYIQVIKFNEVSFGYSKGNYIINNLNFYVEKGKKYAFVGPTGCGKSTILKLCLGLYENVQGEICIFNEKMCFENKFNIRKNMGFVFQDTFLFNGTIYDNIIFANREATLDEVEKVIKIACVDEIINKKNAGLQTIIGENGVQLSGGERQRIGIARTLLKKPKILFLDEATSALDNKTESKIMENIFKEYNDITIIIIAHRLSTITNVDKIFYISNGKIIEEGTHTELLASDSYYNKMYNSYLQESKNQV